MSGYETDDCEWDGFVSPLQMELDENQQKLSLIEEDENNSSIGRIEILKSAMTFQKENDVEMINFQQEQISLLWSELAKNHKVIDQLLEQNTMFYRLLQQNNNSAHVPHENNSSPFLRWQEMAEGYFVNAPISKKFGDQEKNRLVEYLTLLEQDAERLQPVVNQLPFFLRLPVKVFGRVLDKCAWTTCNMLSSDNRSSPS